MSKTTTAQTKAEFQAKLAEMEAEDNHAFIEAVLNRFVSKQTQIAKSGSGNDQIRVSIVPSMNVQTDKVKLMGQIYIQSLTQNKADLEAIINQ